MVDMKPDIVVPPDREMPRGVVVMTPDEAYPYKVVFRLGEATISEHPVSSVREGEALIREELPHIHVSVEH